MSIENPKVSPLRQKIMEQETAEKENPTSPEEPKHPVNAEGNRISPLRQKIMEQKAEDAKKIGGVREDLDNA